MVIRISRRKNKVGDVVTKLTLIVIFCFILLPLASSQPVFKTGEENVSLRVPCTFNGTYCSNSSLCYGTVLDPFQVAILNSQPMIKDGAIFYLTLNSSQISANGEYQFNVLCTDMGNSLAKNLIFFVTPNGEIPSTAKGLLYGGLLFVFVLLMVASIIAGFKLEHVALKTGSFMVAYLFLVGILFISWNLSVDYLTSSPFMASFFHLLWLVLMVGAFPLFIFLFIYTLWMIRQIDVISNMIDKGMPIDEAYERTVKKGFRNRRNW